MPGPGGPGSTGWVPILKEELRIVPKASDSPGQGSIWDEGDAGLKDNQDLVWWKEAVSRQRGLRGTGLEWRTRVTSWEP